MSIKLLTEHHLEFLSLKEACTDSSESTLVKMRHCWKLHVDFFHKLVVLENCRYRGFHMSALVLLNLLNELWKRDKMRGLPSILSLFCNKFNKFNNTGSQMLDSIYHKTLNLLKNHIFGVKR